MDYANEQPNHDEINLVRLLRRLEKSVAEKEEWTTSESQPAEEVWLKVQKALQKVKYARGLAKTIEIECDETPPRLKRLNDAKVQLDKLDALLRVLEHSSKPRANKRESLLTTLPLPKQPSPKDEPQIPANISITGDRTPSPPLDSGWTEKSSSSTLLKPGLFITPPNPEDEIASSLISTALPSLLPVNLSETARSSAFARSFGPAPINRAGTGAVAAAGNQATTALHEELSSQLEQMAQQLKRNAIHFSTSLANDKAVVEETTQKLESNFDVMKNQRVKLRDRKSQSRSNTCLVMGIILLVILVFMLMVSVIRFS